MSCRGNLSINYLLGIVLSFNLSLVLVLVLHWHFWFHGQPCRIDSHVPTSSCHLWPNGWETQLCDAALWVMLEATFEINLSHTCRAVRFSKAL